MTYEELLELKNIEIFVTSDYKSFVFTIETYDEDIDDISIKYYKVAKNSQGIPTIEKINNTIELIISLQNQSKKNDNKQLKLIKIDKNKIEDKSLRDQFISLITAIETSKFKYPQPENQHTEKLKAYSKR